ncbi:LysM peptidoglycan-binding domain-containing protein [bacterium]|nr:LysM peptidoglycan-binding domain-containing protein [bacterium]
MNKSFLIFLFTVSLVGIAFFGCAKSEPRTDVTLELTSPDTIEALVEKDLNTIGTSYQDIDSYPESTPAQVTYVDSVEMQKPLRVQNDDSLYQDEAGINDQYTVPSGNVSVWGPNTDKTLEPLTDRETISVLPPPTGDTNVSSGDGFSGVGTAPVSQTETKSTLQPKPATETTVVTAPNSGYLYQGNSGTSSSSGYAETSVVTSGNTYTVQAGDNLIKIAKKYGLKVSDICEANGISRTSLLKVGQVLKIPGAGSSETSAVTSAPATAPVSPSISSVVTAPESAPQTQSAPTGVQSYTVQAGDSYWKLARRFNSSVEELMSMNNASSDKLQIGQVIKVPAR